MLAGVTSSGTNDECAPLDNSFDADVFGNLAWIEAEGGADLASTTCGAGPQIGEPGHLGPRHQRLPDAAATPKPRAPSRSRPGPPSSASP